MRHAILAVVLLGACEYPNARLTFEISDDPATSCGTNECRDIALPCEAVLSIRIIDPDDPNAPLFSSCELLDSARMDLCALESVRLGDKPLNLPAKTLEFQMVIWPKSEVETAVPGELDCAKHEVKFDAAYGFPVSQDPAPAIGGHTFYHPGDDEIRVKLGCPNLDSLKRCSPSKEVEFRTAVRGFDTLEVGVGGTTAQNILVDVGEPRLRGNDTAYSLRLGDLTPMTPNTSTSPPGFFWTAKFAPEFIDIACVQVLESPLAGATASIRCTTDNIPTGDLTSLELPDAVLMSKARVENIWRSLQYLEFPTDGLTVGVVVDKDYLPLANRVVTATDGTVLYMNNTRTGFDRTSTGDHGIFVSLDAEFGTKFSALNAFEEIGGRVKEHVTIVVIREQ